MNPPGNSHGVASPVRIPWMAPGFRGTVSRKTLVQEGARWWSGELLDSSDLLL